MCLQAFSTLKFTELECGLLCSQALSVHFETLCLQKWSVDCCVHRHLVWTLNFTEVGVWTVVFTCIKCGRLCLQAFGLDFEIYRSGEWTVEIVD